MSDHPPTPPTTANQPTSSDDDWYALIDYLTGEASPAARDAVQRRLAEDPAFAAFAAPVIRLWQTPRADVPWDEDAHWAIIQRQVAARNATTQATTPHPDTPKPRRRLPPHWPRFRASTWAALATAVLLITLVTTRAIYLAQSRYYYEGGTTGATIKLPDGSVAILAPDSYLGTEAGFPSSTREVSLSGEAHFSVVSNPRVPFIVHAAGIGARVLGTTFRIHTDTTPHIRVTVEQGAVALETLDANNHWQQLSILTAGQAQHVSIVQAWLFQAGLDAGNAGVPWLESIRLAAALRRTAFQTGAAEAAHIITPQK